MSRTADRVPAGGKPAAPVAEEAPPGTLAAPDQVDLTALEVLALQRGAGNASVARYLQGRGVGDRRIGGKGKSMGPTAPRENRTEHTEGVIHRTTGSELRASASSRGEGRGHLTYGQRVFVVDGRAGGGMSRVTTLRGSEGFVETAVIKTDLPCPGARLHYVSEGQLAINIAKQYFRHEVKSGRDRRYYVNVLAYMNPAALVDPSVKRWQEVMFRSDFSIWIPTAEFANKLQGRVPDGSITNGLWSRAWKRIKSTVGEAADIAIGAPAFVYGLLKGVVLEVRDILAGLGSLIGSVIGIIKSAFRGEILDDIRGLWNEISGLDIRAVMGGLWNEFAGRWNAGSPWDRWSFRGEVIGRVLMEVVLIFLTAGVSAIVSGTSKFGRLTAAVSRLKSVQRLEQGVRTSSFRVRGRLAQLRTKRRPKRKESAEAIEKRSRGRNAAKPGSGTPRALSAAGQVRRFNPEQRKLIEARIAQARSDDRAYDIRVDQTQVGAAARGRFAPRLGANRPDLQYTDARGRRHIVEYDAFGSDRGIAHLRDALANDPTAIVELWQEVRVRRSGKLVKSYHKVFP